MKTLYASLLFLLFTTPSMAQLSFNSSADSVDIIAPPACMSCPGNIWNTAGNAGSIDSQIASVVLYPNPNCFQTTCYYTRHLYTHLYNFNIPLNAGILGIEVTIARMSGNSNSATDSTLKLVKTAGGYTGQNKASSTPWPVGSTTVTYGSSSDLWGTTWTPAEINDTSFGVWYNIYNSGTLTTTPALDGIEIEVFYAIMPGVVESQSSTFVGKVIWNGAGFQTILGGGIQNAMVEVFDLTGKRVALENSATHGKTLTAKTPETGLYIYKITANGRTQSGKLFVAEN
ncbi:MAG: T9SS type A sorting domain-containing protein [Flavobacteriales bacterium]